MIEETTRRFIGPINATINSNEHMIYAGAAARAETALKQGFEQLADRPLCTKTAVQICTALKGSEMAIRQLPGTVIGNQSTGKIHYTPPVGEQVIRELLANWEQFIHANVWH